MSVQHFERLALDSRHRDQPTYVCLQLIWKSATLCHNLLSTAAAVQLYCILVDHLYRNHFAKHISYLYLSDRRPVLCVTNYKVTRYSTQLLFQVESKVTHYYWNVITKRCSFLMKLFQSFEINNLRGALVWLSGYQPGTPCTCFCWSRFESSLWLVCRVSSPTFSPPFTSLFTVSLRQ